MSEKLLGLLVAVALLGVVVSSAYFIVCPVENKAEAASPPYSAAVMDRLIRIEALAKRILEEQCQCFCDPEEGDQ